MSSSINSSQPNMQGNRSTTSLNTTAFNQDFEAQVNNMNPNTSSASQDQKCPLPMASPEFTQATDGEFNEKMAMKDQGQDQLPPRFSTIFDTKMPFPTIDTKMMPTTPTRAFDSYPQQPTRKSGGVYISAPLFWALFAIFMLESAVLFAYTVIGLVNNMQAQLIHTNGAGAVVAGCDCNAQPINISPNFFMPQAPQVSSIETTTTLSTSITSSTTSTSSSTTSTATSSSSTNIDVSRLADIMKSVGMKTSTSSTHTPTTKVVVITPPGPTISSTLLLTVDPSGNTIAPNPTVTSTKIVDPTLNTRDEPTSIVSISSSGPGITITPVVITTASDGSLVSVSIDRTTTSTTVVANNHNQDSKPESSSTSTVSTTTSEHSTSRLSAVSVIVPSTTKAGVDILASVWMSAIRSSTSAVPSITLSLKSHGQLANKPTQDAENSPSSTATVSTTTTSSSSSSSSSSTVSTSTTSSSTSDSVAPSLTLSSTSSSPSKPTSSSSSLASPSTSTRAPTTPAPTPTTTSTLTLTAPTSTLSAEKSKASCKHKKILGVNAIGCELPADSLDNPTEVIGDILGGIGA